jgi:hypothetical protein
MNEPETFLPLELFVNRFTERDIPLGTIDFPKKGTVNCN